MFFSTCFAVGGAILSWYHREMVVPIAGLTTDFSMPARKSGATALPPLTVKQFDVHNPGPGAFSVIELEVVLPNKCVSPDAPPDGLTVEAVNGAMITYEPMKGGVWT